MEKKGRLAGSKNSTKTTGLVLPQSPSPEEPSATDQVTPKQLMKSLLGPNVRYVLIKGEPGVGKTTLALELMKDYGGGAYVSTRVSKQLALEQQPMIKALLDSGRIAELNIDVENFSFGDFRLSSQQDILTAILDGVGKTAKDPLIVLDSWDSVAKRIDPVERQKTEQAMLVMAEARGARVIFVSEEPALTTVDYIVDAVVALSDEVLNGRRIRRISWKKLRGSPIPQRSFLYTLHEGKFTVFENTRMLRPGTFPVKPFKPIRNTENFFSSGSPDMDRFLGQGISRGFLVVLELGEHVNPASHIPILQSIESNFLANDGCVFIVPTTHSTPMSAKAKLALYFSEEELRSKLRIGHFQTYPADPCFIKLSNESIGSDSEKVSREIQALKAKGYKNCAFFLGVDTLESFIPEDLLTRMASGYSQSMKVSGDILIAVIKPGSKMSPLLTNSCDIHLKLEEVDRTLILYSLNPASELYHVRYDYSVGYPEVKLTPIL